ncbi:MAG: hypothetical protein HC854_16960 [Flavobacterium sp.]|nr:hypothetical protein [Flavobacterium sp.]
MESSELSDFFENQNLNISNEFWTVEISYSKINFESKKIEIEKVIEFQNEYQSDSIFVSIQKKIPNLLKI